MRTTITIAIALVGLSAGGSFAEESTATKAPSKKPKAELTHEQRQKMADLHITMADCLKSNKPINECRKEMMKGCHEAMGKEGCPQGMMMGGMHSMDRHMKSQMGGMMGTEPEEGSTDQKQK